MKKFQILERFPLGSITASGFLRDQMVIGRDGICGHLHELEPEMIAAPFIRDFHVSSWQPYQNLGWGAEIAGNYWSGYIQYAFTLNDTEMIDTAAQWVAGVLARQRADGYLGTYCHENDNIYEDYNAWGTACAARGLIAFYEATGRSEILDAVHRAMLWFCDAWAGDKKTCYAGGYIIEPMIQTYHYTQDRRLVEFSENYLDFMCRHNIFGNSYQQMLQDDYHYNLNHTAGLGITVRLPALVYTATGKEAYLNATLRRLHQFRGKSVQITGAPVSPAEYLGPVSAVTDSEYCGFTFYQATYAYLSAITGEPKYGDYMEEVFYNAAQGARKKDEKAIAYMSSPNQIFATEQSSSVGVGDMQVYAPCYPTACCPVNAVAIVPEFVRGMLLRDEADNIYTVAYGPCELNYRDIHITEKTGYPFRDHVSFEFHCSRRFAINLRIPEWSRGYSVTVNGEAVSVSVNRLGYAVVYRQWSEGDVLDIRFRATIQVIPVDDSDAANKQPLAIKYGALVYSYHISEDWQPIAGRPTTPLPDGWSWYNVYPRYEEAQAADHYEKIGLRRQQFSWNIALDEDLQAEDFEIEELDDCGYVWSQPPIRLHTHCYKAPYLNAPYQEKTLEPYGQYQFVTERLPLTLVPYGCTNLRITYFPRADLSGKRSL